MPFWWLCVCVCVSVFLGVVLCLCVSVCVFLGQIFRGRKASTFGYALRGALGLRWSCVTSPPGILGVAFCKSLQIQTQPGTARMPKCLAAPQKATKVYLGYGLSGPLNPGPHNRTCPTPHHRYGICVATRRTKVAGKYHTQVESRGNPPRDVF